MLEGIREYKVHLTREAIYDVADIADYIEIQYGRLRADCFQSDMKKELDKLGYMGRIFPKTQFFYRGYAIHKKLFPPSIIFYIVIESREEIHILRVLREERDWQNILEGNQIYTYPE